MPMVVFMGEPHNKRMLSDRSTRYASETAADAGVSRYAQ